jgi:hypothetical protein
MDLQEGRSPAHRLSYTTTANCIQLRILKERIGQDQTAEALLAGAFPKDEGADRAVGIPDIFDIQNCTQ